MKKLLFILSISVSFLGLAQVDTSILIKSQYVEFFNWDNGQDEYVLEDEDWLDITMDPYDDYYLIEIDNDGDIEKIWWEHSENIQDFDGDAYFTKDGRKIVFNYADQEIWFFYDYYEQTDRYLKLMIVSKIGTYEK
tara:strand:+ start:143 stop:550 length:408 start_codon:yes stop_codon:yes gene_type:complete